MSRSPSPPAADEIRHGWHLPSVAPAVPVAFIRGIIFQSDAASGIGTFLIRPAEHLDQWWAGLHETDAQGQPRNSPLAMHAGLHVVLTDGREFVVQQLSRGWRELFLDGLHWTPLEEFRARDYRERGGWDATVPMRCFRAVDAAAEAEALVRLATITGRPFLKEDCTAFLGRVFAGRRLFADSPLLRAVGLALRSGEPALPLLRADAALDKEAAWRLRADALRVLPDAQAGPNGLSLRWVQHHGLLVSAAVTLLVVVVARLLRSVFLARFPART